MVCCLFVVSICSIPTRPAAVSQLPVRSFFCSLSLHQQAPSALVGPARLLRHLLTKLPLLSHRCSASDCRSFKPDLLPRSLPSPSCLSML